MPFYKREEELNNLNKLFENKGFNNVLLYGRRRVGKSEIINTFINSNKYKHVFYQCIKSNDDNNIKSLSKLIGEVFNTSNIYFNNFDDIFNFLLEKAKDEIVIFVLDEYSYWREINPSLDSILQRCLDKSKNSNLKVILCGSELSCMESLDYENAPLFGRFQIKMKVLPFDYYDSASFFSSLPNEDKVKYYSVFGGMPYILSYIDTTFSFEDNVIESYLNRYSFVSSFIETTVKEEVNKIEYANSIILSIANGFHKYSDILSQSHINNNITMDRALSLLISLDIIIKESPINDNKNKKKTLYYIKDNAIAFYYRYIFPNLSYLRYMSETDFYYEFIKKDLEEKFIPHRFEMIAKEFLIRLNKKKLLNPPFYKIGKYYYDLPKEKRNGEFDVVTFDKFGYKSYEVKYKDSLLTSKDINKAKNALKDIPLGENIRLGFISKKGYEEECLNKDGFFKLDDIYSLV